ncbi:hypothetical protein ACJX0J_028495, partial [Zea mays]
IYKIINNLCDIINFGILILIFVQKMIITFFMGQRENIDFLYKHLENLSYLMFRPRAVIKRRVLDHTLHPIFLNEPFKSEEECFPSDLTSGLDYIFLAIKILLLKEIKKKYLKSLKLEQFICASCCQIAKGLLVAYQI